MLFRGALARKPTRALARKPSGRRRGAWQLGRRGTVSIIFACALPMLVVAVGVGIDFSRIVDARAALQRAVDGAALSGAAAYVLYTQGDAFNAVAVSTANAAFCKDTAALPAGATLVASTGTGSTQCNGGAGPATAAVIGGYVPGTRGAAANSGCSATNTVVAGVTCGFLVTVTANATVTPAFSGFLGGARTVTATAMAANPFLDLGSVLSVNLTGSIPFNANSIWVYPLRLDSNGSPDFSTDPGARPPLIDPASGKPYCTGSPVQVTCGSYTMLSSQYFRARNCTQSSPCNVNGTIVGGTGGIVQNPQVSTEVITATTPLGFAFESTSGGIYSFGRDTASTPQPSNSQCTWPVTTAYHTVTQVYPPGTDGTTNPPASPLEGRQSNGSVDWSLTTHWFYSSFLTNNLPPNNDELQTQGTPHQVQSVPAATTNQSTSCNENRSLSTTFPQNTNCNLYIARDPASTLPDPSYHHNDVCWAPSSTPGAQYAALSCQAFAGHTFIFFWNDMGGAENSNPGEGDNTDYNDGVTTVNCTGSSIVRLIN